MTITSEDVKLVEKFIDIKNRGYYANGGEVTAVYNRVLGKNVQSTNCSSCIRQRIGELENALNKFKRQMEVNKPEENKESEEPKKKVGRPPKKTE